MKKIPLIGGEGYIGSVLVNDLINNNFQIKSLDLNIYDDQKQIKFNESTNLDCLRTRY